MNTSLRNPVSRNLSLSFVCGVVASLATAPVRAAENESPPAAPRTVSVEQYNKLVRYVKTLNDRIKALEAGATAASVDGSGEETVDLGAMGAAQASPSKGPGAHKKPVAEPMFKTLFDLNLVSRPGISPLSFENYHPFLLFEVAPTPELQFSFDVNPTPNYYEVDYQVSKSVQLRLGKIWIPFDDLSPHNIFGGRVNVSRLNPGAAFLPDLWTDLGVGVKVDWIDRPSFSLLTHLYLVNGFRDGQEDPLDEDGHGTQGYPSFGSLPASTDNNDNKALGGRIAMKFAGGLFSMGLSGYYGQWTDQELAAKSLLIYGSDAQLRFAATELRAGLALMKVDLLSGDHSARAGGYLEYGQKFGRKSPYKLLFRTGALQMDDRLIDANDQTWVGATFLWQPGPIQLSLEHSRDLQLSAPGKLNTSYTIARFVLAL